MATVPFTTTTHAGFADVTGQLRMEDSCLHVDFELADSITGILKTNTKVQISQEQIADAHFKKGFFRGTICVRVKDMEVLQEIPWRKGAEFEVTIRRRDRADAQQFAEDLAWFAAD